MLHSASATALEYAWRRSDEGKRRTLRLWLAQNKRCPMCKQLITFETGWNIHHIIERHKGGGDELGNLVLLHPNCHRQIHSGAPAPAIEQGLTKA